MYCCSFCRGNSHLNFVCMGNLVCVMLSVCVCVWYELENRRKTCSVQLCNDYPMLNFTRSTIWIVFIQNEWWKTWSTHTNTGHNKKINHENNFQAINAGWMLLFFFASKTGIVNFSRYFTVSLFRIFDIKHMWKALLLDIPFYI